MTETNGFALALADAFSIADIERDTGIHKDTLRVWERRYGFPRPTRSAKGERVYDATQLAKLQLIKRLMDAGHRPNQVVGKTESDLRNILQNGSTSLKKRKNKVINTFSVSHESWLDWLQAGQLELLRNALEQHILRQGLGRTIDELLTPLGAQVGQAWLAGQLRVYHEHAYSEVVQSVLRQALNTLDSNLTQTASGPRVLFSTLPGEMHGMGLLMAECFFAMANCERVSLGVNTPLQDIADAAHQQHIDLVAISLSAHAHVKESRESLRRLRELLPSATQIWLGGQSKLLLAKSWPPGLLVLDSPLAIAPAVAQWRLLNAGDQPTAAVEPSSLSA